MFEDLLLVREKVWICCLVCNKPIHTLVKIEFISELRKSRYHVVSHKAGTPKDFPCYSLDNLLSINSHVYTIP